MKKFVLMVIMTVMSATLTMAANNPAQTAARKAAEAMLTQAVNLGYGSTVDKDKILKSGIVEEAFIDSDYNFAKAVDKAAEVAVREGWFKNKAAAKRALRQACEKARTDKSLFQRIYSLLGI